ncbi:MAG: mycothiol synthase [Kineosporiaceae bacterium]|nr:mycothiol synthase [Kineosporiaceae bacterium]
MSVVTVSVLPELSPDQVASVTALCHRAAQADGTEPLSEHVRLHLRQGGDRGDRPDGGDRHLIAVAGDGIVGYAHLDPTDLVAGPAAEVVVDPERRGRGVGRTLVEAVIAASPDGRLRLWAHGLHPAARRLAASLGFVEERRLEQWRRSLTEPLPPVSLPHGVRLRSFVPGVDDEAWLELNSRAFADHPEQGGWTVRDLHVRLAESWFDREGFLIAEQEGETGPNPGRAGGNLLGRRMIGFHWTKVHGSPAGHAHEPIGEVYVVGVDPDHQGRRLGRELTLAGLHRLAETGLEQAMLYVEADNAPAKAVYHALGFAHHDTDVMYERRHD